MTDEAWTKLIEIFVPKRNTEGKRFGYVQSLKLWNRAWDNAEKVLVRMQ
jgi:ribosomal protein L17